VNTEGTHSPPLLFRYDRNNAEENQTTAEKSSQFVPRREIQWNKVHVIATREQGILIKRVLPAEDEGKLRLVSDNKDYPPFDVPRSEICGLALVAGVIRLE